VGKRDSNTYSRPKGWIVLDHCDNPKMNCQFDAECTGGTTRSDSVACAQQQIGSACVPCDGALLKYAGDGQCCATDACLPGGARLSEKDKLGRDLIESDDNVCVIL
jgi:hypothetical protein